MSFERLARRLKIIGGKVEKETNRLVIQTTLAIDQALVLGTPVDSGRARSNWLVSIGAPRTDTIEPYAPGSGLGIGEGANASGALAQGRRVIEKRQPGQTIYLANNLVYIGRLNEGHSAQAPAMFIEMAIDAGEAFLKRAQLKL